jgi:RNA polymerase sigma factor (TIGR02999 family)
MTDPVEITQLLEDASLGGEDAARNLMPLVYGELRELAARHLRNESPGHTLQPSALVNEAFLKLISQSRISYAGRMHFFAIGSTLMRRILVDHARRKKRDKRGGRQMRIELTDSPPTDAAYDEEILAVHEAIDKLTQLDPRQAQIVQLRFFGGMKMEEIATELGVSKRTVEGECTMVRAWLKRELANDDSP